MFRRVRVHGQSMQPTFEEGDVLWSNRLVYWFFSPRRGDVVVLDHPSRPLRLLKRIMAVPGDRVDGRILGPDEYFVSGDNPVASTDSAVFGPVQRRAIRGRVRPRRRNA